MNKAEKEKYYKTKTMLNNYLLKKAEIKDKEIENEMLKFEDGLGALEYKEMTGKTYKISSNVENTILSVEDNIEHNKKIIAFNKMYIEKIDNALTIIQNKFIREVIVHKFLIDRTTSWKDVAIKLSNTADACRKASEQGIKILSKILL